MNELEILIVGANGQLGKALALRYPSAQKVDYQELDISDTNAVQNYDWSKVKIIINAAAYTNVDGAETDDGRIIAWNVNSKAVGNLTREALKHDLTLVHVSTEYVFDGRISPHIESELFSPLGVYGQTKAAGDIVVSLLPHHYILRTSWVIGDGKNFVKTMLEVGKKGISPSVVNDQIGRLTFTGELVRAIDYLLSKGCEYGTYNISNGGDSVSWAEITREIFKEAAFNLDVIDVSTEKYFNNKEASPRPLQSTMDLSKIEATGFVPKDWRRALSEYVKKEINE